MPDWPLYPGGPKSFISTVNESTSFTPQIAASTTANTKGSWVEIVSSTEYDVDEICVAIQTYQNQSPADYLFDIGIGASGSEVVVLSNMLLSVHNSISRIKDQINIPIKIPTGSRVSIRCQASFTTGGIFLAVIFNSNTHSTKPGSSKIITYGDNTADSGGTTIDPGTTSHTKGNWSELTSATDLEHRWLLMVLGMRANANPYRFTTLIDIGIGSSGSETVLIPNIPASVFENSYLITPAVFGPFNISIPKGTRLAIRAQSSSTDSVDRLFDAILYGGS